MVSADSLNLDVLELVFAFLPRKDLPNVALVSRPFLAGVVPRLYHTLAFRLHHAKRYPKVPTAFSAIIAHPELAVHVRNIDIRAIPTLNGHIHSIFVKDCLHALRLCNNLNKFTYTTETLAPFLSALVQRTQLKEIRICAKLTTDQAEKLLNFQKLESLVLDSGSWNVMNIIPKWTFLNQRQLTNVTFYASSELNEGILQSAVSELPQLLGLHVVRCPKINHMAVLRLVSHTPLLNSLAFTVTDTSHIIDISPPPLHHLIDLAIDARLTPAPESAVSLILPSIIRLIKLSCPSLSTFSLKIPELVSLNCHVFIASLMNSHATTLTRLSILDCNIGSEIIAIICKACTHLEQLWIPLPVKDIDNLSKAISYSSSLRTLIDADTHITHGPRPCLNQENIRHMMKSARNLKKIISDKRIWTGRQGAENTLEVSFERQPTHSARSHWFMPHD